LDEKKSYDIISAEKTNNAERHLLFNENETERIEVNGFYGRHPDRYAGKAVYGCQNKKCEVKYYKGEIS